MGGKHQQDPRHRPAKSQHTMGKASTRSATRASELPAHYGGRHQQDRRHRPANSQNTMGESINKIRRHRPANSHHTMGESINKIHDTGQKLQAHHGGKHQQDPRHGPASSQHTMGESINKIRDTGQQTPITLWGKASTRSTTRASKLQAHHGGKHQQDPRHRPASSQHTMRESINKIRDTGQQTPTPWGKASTRSATQASKLPEHYGGKHQQDRRHRPANSHHTLGESINKIHDTGQKLQAHHGGKHQQDPRHGPASSQHTMGESINKIRDTGQQTPITLWGKASTRSTTRASKLQAHHGGKHQQDPRHRPASSQHTMRESINKIRDTGQQTPTPWRESINKIRDTGQQNPSTPWGKASTRSATRASKLPSHYGGKHQQDPRHRPANSQHTMGESINKIHDTGQQAPSTPWGKASTRSGTRSSAIWTLNHDR